MQHTKKTVHDLSITFHCSLPCYSTIFRTSPSSRSSSKTKAAYMITLSVPLHLLQSALLFFFRHLLIKQIWFFHTLLTVLRGLDLDLEWSLPLDVDLERFLSELLERRRELLEWWWDLLEWWWDPLEWWWDPLEWWRDSFSSRRLLLELSGISIPFSAAIYALSDRRSRDRLVGVVRIIDIDLYFTKHLITLSLCSIWNETMHPSQRILALDVMRNSLAKERTSEPFSCSSKAIMLLSFFNCFALSFSLSIFSW